MDYINRYGAEESTVAYGELGNCAMPDITIEYQHVYLYVCVCVCVCVLLAIKIKAVQFSFRQRRTTLSADDIFLNTHKLRNSVVLFLLLILKIWLTTNLNSSTMCDCLSLGEQNSCCVKRIPQNP
jgi:hypothetical protein